MHSAVAKAGLVKDLYAWEYPVGLYGLVSVNGGWEHLLQGLAGIDKAIKGRCFHIYAILGDVDVVLLRAQVRVGGNEKPSMDVLHAYCSAERLDSQSHRRIGF